MLQQEGSDDDCEALDVPCHTLNLVADSDNKATLKDDKYNRMYDRVTGNIQALTSVVSRSIKMLIWHNNDVQIIVPSTSLVPIH